MFSFSEMTHLDVVTHTVSVLLLLLLLLSCFRVQLFVTPWAAAHQKLPFLGVSRQEHWSGVPLPSPVLCINWSLYTVLALTCQLGHVGKMLETQWPGVRGTGCMEQNVQGQVQMSCSSPSDKCPQGRHWTDAESRRHSGFGDLATAAGFLFLSLMYLSKSGSQLQIQGQRLSFCTDPVESQKCWVDDHLPSTLMTPPPSVLIASLGVYITISSLVTSNIKIPRCQTSSQKRITSKQ